MMNLVEIIGQEMAVFIIQVHTKFHQKIIKTLFIIKKQLIVKIKSLFIIMAD